jgi:hypothetical protein
MKNVLLSLFWLVLICVIGLLSFFYYIKPQRELIATQTQDCLVKAMSQINGIVKKTFYSGTYTTEAGLNNMLKDQNVAIEECKSNYDSILFSGPERKLFEISVDAKINQQEGMIGAYIASVKTTVSKAKTQEAQKQACLEMKRTYKTVHDGYDKCVQEGMKNNTTNLMDYMTPGNDNPCSKKYNITKYFDNSFGCSINFGINIMN